MKSIFTTLNKIHVIININGDVMKVRGKVSLIVGWITLFLIGIDLFVVSPLLPFISEAYNTSPSMTGWMVTVFAITYAVFAPFFGWLSDRNGRGAYITFGLVLFATSNILTAFAPTFFRAYTLSSLYANAADSSKAAHRSRWFLFVLCCCEKEHGGRDYTVDFTTLNITTGNMLCLAGKLGVPNWAERLTIPGN